MHWFNTLCRNQWQRRDNDNDTKDNHNIHRKDNDNNDINDNDINNANTFFSLRSADDANRKINSNRYKHYMSTQSRT